MHKPKVKVEVKSRVICIGGCATIYSAVQFDETSKKRRGRKSCVKEPCSAAEPLMRKSCTAWRICAGRMDRRMDRTALGLILGAAISALRFRRQLTFVHWKHAK